MNKNPISEAAARLGRRGLGKPKRRMTEADRQRRRDWAAGLQARRKAQVKLSRFTVIDRSGRQWAYEAESVQHAVTLARHDGIDAVAGKAAI